MGQIAFVVPLLPGKMEALKAFTHALLGERKAEYESPQVSVTKECWFVQPTPMGEIIIIYFEATDPAAVFTNLAASQEPFDIWFKQQVQDITGIDPAQPMPGTPTCVFDWSRG